MIGVSLRHEVAVPRRYDAVGYAGAEVDSALRVKLPGTHSPVVREIPSLHGKITTINGDVCSTATSNMLGYGVHTCGMGGLQSWKHSVRPYSPEAFARGAR